MQNSKFYHCKHCGNLLDVMNDGGPVPVCCGEPMVILAANTSDGAGEKHVPAVQRDGKDVKIQIGSSPHVMVPEHYIEWIYVKQGAHVQHVALKPGDEPTAHFTLHCDKSPITVYEYCNLHGLWSTEA